MTPQQLINLPYAGMAEKALREAGMWRLTEQEKTEKRLDDALGALEEIEHIAGGF